MQTGNSLTVQWLGLSPFTTEGWNSIPGQGTKILYAVRHGQNSNKQTTPKTNFFLLICIFSFFYNKLSFIYEKIFQKRYDLSYILMKTERSCWKPVKSRVSDLFKICPWRMEDAVLMLITGQV